MKHLKAFEELHRDTYFNAADKFDKAGHTNRADAMRKHAKGIKYSEDEITYYLKTLGMKTVNPIMKTDTIADMKIIVTPRNEINEPKRSIMNRIKGEKIEPEVKHLGEQYKLEVTMSKGDSFTFYLGFKKMEFFGGDLDTIHFLDRKEAYKFVKMCNDFIQSEIGGKIPTDLDIDLLNVNNFYSN